MRAFKRSLVTRWVLVPLVLIAFSWSCTKWSFVGNPWPTVQARHPQVVRVTLPSSEQLTLANPRLEHDTLIGTVPMYKARGSRYFHGVAGKYGYLAIPTEDVAAVEIPRTDALKTVAAAGIGLLLVAAIIAVATADEPSPPPPSSPGDGDFSSCPLVYTWDGIDWRLDSGTFGGAFLQPLGRTDTDVLEHASPSDGRLRLRVANQLAETDYLDEISVYAVEHAPGVTVAPTIDGRLLAFEALIPPAIARDLRGRDALARVHRADGWSWESSLSQRDTANPADLVDGLDLVFPRPKHTPSARLLIDAHNTTWAAYLIQEYVRWHGSATDAWYDSLNADPVRAARLGRKMAAEGFLRVRLWTGDEWRDQGLIWEAGPEVAKRQAMELDLTRLDGDTLRLRLESAPAYWLIDRVAVDYGREAPLTMYPLELELARTADGDDVRDALAASDGRELVLEPGSGAELSLLVPALAPGLEHTYVLRSSGWYRIHGSSIGEPRIAALARVENEPGAIARLSVARMNRALEILAEGRAP